MIFYGNRSGVPPGVCDCGVDVNIFETMNSLYSYNKISNRISSLVISKKGNAL
jgi:hypothetical protein